MQQDGWTMNTQICLHGIQRNFSAVLKTCLLLVWVMCCASAWASHQSNTLQIDLQEAKINLKGHLAVYRDRIGTRTIEEVADPQKDLFKPIQSGLSEGFTSDAVWVGFTLSNESKGTPAIRWLELTQPLLFNAQLFKKTDDGLYAEIPGLLNKALPRGQHNYQRSIFEIRLDDDRPQSFYLRLVSPSSISTEFILWAPGEFVAYSTVHRFLSGSIYGAYMIMIIFYMAFAFWTRQRIHLLYAVYITTLGMASFYSGAWPMQFFPQLEQGDFFKMLGFWICMNPPLVMLFSFSYLNLRGGWLRFSQLVIGVAAVTAGFSIWLVMTDRYVLAMPMLQTMAMSVISLACLTALIHSAKGNKNARILLFSFGFFYVGATLRLLKNIGVLEPSFWTENGYQIGTFIHMLIMSGTVFSLYSKMRREKQQAEYRLQAEIHLRQEQSDFMAMVSHEFRTPMAIIDATTTNLLNDATLPAESQKRVEKIVRANTRLTGLMQDYLNHERLMSEATSLEPEVIDLNTTVQEAVSQFSESIPRPQYVAPAAPILVMADKKMVEMIVYNLLSNALRYAPGCQPVVHCETLGFWGQFRVFNEGEGIPEADLPYIFQKFFRGKNASGTTGSGLGLYLIRTIVEKLNGQVFATNLSTGGCEFIVRLPLRTVSGSVP